MASLAELASLYGQLPGLLGSNKTGTIGPFVHVQPVYSSSTELSSSTVSVFTFLSGDAAFGLKSNGFFAWAVRPGDSIESAAEVPAPATTLLLGIALLGLRLAGWWRG